MGDNPLAPASTAADRYSPPPDARSPTNGPGVTRHGVPLDEGDVEVATSRDGAHFVFSGHTLRCAADGSLRDTRRALWYRDAAVERDFVAFSYDSRTAFWVLSAYLFVACVVSIVVTGRMPPHGVVMLLVACAAAIVSDAFTERLYRHCRAAHCLGRTARARVHEMLMAALMVTMAVGNTYAAARNDRTTYCPGEPMHGKAHPLPTPADYAAVGGPCMATSIGDGGVIVLLAMFFSGRIATQGAGFAVIGCAVVLLQTVNIFQVRPDDFYRVSTFEYVHRAAEAIVRTTVALLLTRVGERRTRRQFEVCVQSAVAVVRRRVALHQLRDLRRRVAPPTAGGAQLSDAPAVFMVRVALTAAHGTLALDGCDALDEHFAAVTALAALACVPPRAAVWASGVEVVFAVPSFDTSAPGSATGSTDEEPPQHAEAAVAACRVAHAAVDAVARLHAACSAWAAAGLTASASIVRDAPCGRNPRLVPAAAAAVQVPTVAGEVLVDGAVAELVRHELQTSTLRTATSGATWTTIAPSVRGPADVVSTRTSPLGTPPPLWGPAPPALAVPNRTPHTVSEPSDDGDRITAQLSTVSVPTDSWCGSTATLLVACAPRFANSDIEAAFTASDDVRVWAHYAVAATTLTLALLQLALLAYFDAPDHARYSAITASAACLAAVVGGAALRFMPVLTAYRRLAVVIGSYVLWLSTVFYVRLSTRAPFVSASVLTTGGMLSQVFIVLPPDHPAPRSAAVVVFTAIGAATSTLPYIAPGFQQLVLALPISLVMLAFISVVHTRRHRAHFASTVALEDTRRELVDVNAAMDAELRQFMPPVYTRMLRDAPEHGLCRGMSLPATTVLVVDVHPDWRGRSNDGYATTRGAGLAHAQRELASSLPDCFVAAHGDMLAASVADESGLLCPSNAPMTPAALAAHLLWCAFGCQPMLRSADHRVQHLATFPPGTTATIRAGMHRAGLVVGLTGAATLSFSVMGPALDGATRLARLSLAVGSVVTSSDADWRAAMTHDVPGIGAVSVTCVRAALQRP